MAGAFRLETAKASGSAFRVAPDEVLTAAHVVEGVDRVRLVPLDGDGEYLVGTVRWRDDVVDVAVLTVDNDADAPQRPLSSAAPMPGQDVYVVGAPIGIAKITTGEVVRATELDFLASAPVESGNSGGPVLDHEGNAIGMIIERTADGSSGRAISAATLAKALAKARLNPQESTQSRSLLATLTPHLLTALAVLLMVGMIILIVMIRRRANRPKPIVITLD
jgi:S1-C subfamily serine protease